MGGLLFVRARGGAAGGVGRFSAGARGRVWVGRLGRAALPTPDPLSVRQVTYYLRTGRVPGRTPGVGTTRGAVTRTAFVMTSDPSTVMDPMPSTVTREPGLRALSDFSSCRNVTGTMMEASRTGRGGLPLAAITLTKSYCSS